MPSALRLWTYISPHAHITTITYCDYYYILVDIVVIILSLWLLLLLPHTMVHLMQHEFNNHTWGLAGDENNAW